MFFYYLFYELKRGGLVLKKSILWMLVCLVIFIAGIAATVTIQKQSQVLHFIEVGIIVPEDETMTKMIMQYVSSMDSVQSICHFSYLGEEDAYEKMKEGEFSAVISFPKEFFSDVDSGKNTPAVLCVPRDSKLHVKLFQELVLDGVEFLQVSEAGVYASLDTADVFKAKMSKHDIGNYIAELYARTVLNRSDIYEKKVVSPLGQSNATQYYLVSGVLGLLLFIGLNCGFLYQKQAKAVEQRLCMYGLDEKILSLVRIVAMTIMLYLMALAVYIGICVVMAVWLDGSIYFQFSFAWGLIFVCAVLASCFHAVYGLAGGYVHGMVFLLVIDLFMVVCCGLILPAAYFGTGVTALGEILPLGFCQKFLLLLLNEECKYEVMVNMAVYIVVGYLLGALGLCRNT